MYKQLAISFFIVLVIAITFYVIRRMSSSKNSSSRKIGLTVLFICYLSAVAAVTIVPLRSSRTASLDHHFNFKPVINSYHRYLNIRIMNDPDATANFRNNLFGNILLFIPLGIFLPWLYHKKFLKAVLIAFLASSFIELMQFVNMSIGYYRYVDVDDIILNTFGAILGYWLYKVVINAGKFARV